MIISWGGKFKLDINLAKSAVERIANRLSLTVEQAAHAIFTTVNSFMADTITEVSTKQGYDVRDFSLVACGGAGSVHGAFIAELLGIPEVIVPKFAATFCAWGMFAMDVGRNYVRSYVTSATDVNIDIVNQLYQEMMAEALQEFTSLKVPKEMVAMSKSADMRYTAQFHDVEVMNLPEADITSEDIEQAVQAFHQKHEKLYGFSLPFVPVLFRNLRLTAKTRGQKITVREIVTGIEDASEALKRKRSCFFDGGYMETPIYDGNKLKSGNIITGSAVIEEETTTVVIPKGFHCIVNKYGNYIIRR